MGICGRGLTGLSNTWFPGHIVLKGCGEHGIPVAHQASFTDLILRQRLVKKFRLPYETDVSKEKATL